MIGDMLFSFERTLYIQDFLHLAKSYGHDAKIQERKDGAIVIINCPVRQVIKFWENNAG